MQTAISDRSPFPPGDRSHELFFFLERERGEDERRESETKSCRVVSGFFLGVRGREWGWGRRWGLRLHFDLNQEAGSERENRIDTDARISTRNPFKGSH